MADTAQQPAATGTLVRLKRSDFDFDLPHALIAQEPPRTRGLSRLLVVDRLTGHLADHQFDELPSLLRAGDLLVVNNTRVFAARLLGSRLPGGGAAECLLIRRLETISAHTEVWEALVHPGQRLRAGSKMELGPRSMPIHAQVLDRRFHGRRSVRLWTEAGSLQDVIDCVGHVPLPPYIKRPDTPQDRDRYQTVYAAHRGSIAAPTAGLHFTPELLAAIDRAGVERTAITLHVGYGTFEPVRVDHIEEHRMEPEHYDVPPEAAAAISRALNEKRRIVAVGTTTTRTLESLLRLADGSVEAQSGVTDLFILPGHEFRVVSGLITNFHLPQSSLLMLVSAFAGQAHVRAAYRHAVTARYRFYSYGDAMFLR